MYVVINVDDKSITIYRVEFIFLHFKSISYKYPSLQLIGPDCLVK